VALLVAMLSLDYEVLPLFFHFTEPRDFVPMSNCSILFNIIIILHSIISWNEPALVKPMTITCQSRTKKQNFQCLNLNCEPLHYTTTSQLNIIIHVDNSSGQVHMLRYVIKISWQFAIFYHYWQTCHNILS
jgi:hypothetical protein